MIKELDDYMDTMKKKYPYIPEYELKRILEYGFNSFYLLNRSGADIQVHNGRYNAYCGKLFGDPHMWTLYLHLKWRIKFRLKYKFAQEVYNGMYYFGLSDAEWEFYQSQKTSKRRNKIKFTNVKFYKIKEECFLDRSKKHFFILYYPIDVGWHFIKEEITTRNFKYFAYKDNNNNIINI